MKTFEEKLKAGLIFEDFCNWALMRYAGICYVPYRTRAFQYDVGENSAGIECKLDLQFEKTGNLYIEIAERHEFEHAWVKSGIYRSDNARHLCIGSTKKLFLLSKQILQLLAKRDRYRRVEIKTSQGFLLPDDEAKKFACDVIEIPEKDVICLLGEESARYDLATP